MSDLIPEEAFLNFLKTRQGLIDGVVITGGEPTLQKDLATFIGKIKALNFLVKLDTNGRDPTLLKELIDEKKVDFVAMDIKYPFDIYSKINGVNEDITKYIECKNILLN